MDKLDRDINVLLPDGERILSLYVINCLSNFKQIKIHVLSQKKWTETRFSKKITSFNYYEVKGEKEWIEIIKIEILEKNIDVLFPVEIENIRLLSKHNEKFKLLVPNLVLPTVHSFDIANNKWNLYKLLKENNINSPITYRSSEFLMNNDYVLEYPVLLKPFVGMGGFGIEMIEDETSLINMIQKDRDSIIQRFIKGYDIDMSVLCMNGKILAYSIQKGYIYSSALYSAPLGVDFLYCKELFNTVQQLMKKLNWSGFAHIDLRYDEIEKNYKVLEINPRIWGSIEASNKVGVNFPYLYCLSSLGINYEVPNYRFEKCVSNNGLIKILMSRLKRNNKNLEFPKNTIINSFLTDPLPLIFNFYSKKVKKQIL